MCSSVGVITTLMILSVIPGQSLWITQQIICLYIHLPLEAKLLGRYFNWLLLSTTSGSIIGVTMIVKISLTYGWWWGFFLSTILSFIGFSVLSPGTTFYRLQIPGDSPIIQVLRVLVAAFKNRKLSLSENANELYESKEEATVAPKHSHTNQFRVMIGLDLAYNLHSAFGNWFPGSNHFLLRP